MQIQVLAPDTVKLLQQPGGTQREHQEEGHPPKRWGGVCSLVCGGEGEAPRPHAPAPSNLGGEGTHVVPGK